MGWYPEICRKFCRGADFGDVSLQGNAAITVLARNASDLTSFFLLMFDSSVLNRTGKELNIAADGPLIVAGPLFLIFVVRC